MSSQLFYECSGSCAESTWSKTTAASSVFTSSNHSNHSRESFRSVWVASRGSIGELE